MVSRNTGRVIFFPSPHSFIPFYRETGSWKPELLQSGVSGFSRTLTTRRTAHSHPSWSKSHQYGGTLSKMNNSILSSNINVFLLLEKQGKNVCRKCHKRSGSKKNNNRGIKTTQTEVFSFTNTSAFAQLEFLKSNTLRPVTITHFAGR